MRARRAQIDDATPPPSAHVRHCVLGTEERRGEIRVQDAPPRPCVHRRDRFDDPFAYVVDQDVDSAEPPDRRLDDPSTFRAVVRSARTAIACRPSVSIDATVRRAACASARYPMATSAPARARARAITFPIRRDPPVTRAARPARPMPIRGTPERRFAFRKSWCLTPESGDFRVEAGPPYGDDSRPKLWEASERTGSNGGQVGAPRLAGATFG